MVTIHPEFVVDDQNVKKSVVLPYAEWQIILAELEELEDIRAYDAAKSQPSSPLLFQKVAEGIERGEAL